MGQSFDVVIEAPGAEDPQLPHGVVVHRVFQTWANGSNRLDVVIQNNRATPVTLRAKLLIGRARSAIPLPEPGVCPLLEDAFPDSEGNALTKIERLQKL